jgi:hypothetical protein
MGVGEKERKRQKIHHLVGGLNAGSNQSTTLCFSVSQHNILRSRKAFSVLHLLNCCNRELVQLLLKLSNAVEETFSRLSIIRGDYKANVPHIKLTVANLILPCFLLLT